MQPSGRTRPAEPERQPLPGPRYWPRVYHDYRPLIGRLNEARADYKLGALRVADARFVVDDLGDVRGVESRRIPCS
jgi:hypothetical protein